MFDFFFFLVFIWFCVDKIVLAEPNRLTILHEFHHKLYLEVDKKKTSAHFNSIYNYFGIFEFTRIKIV